MPKAQRVRAWCFTWFGYTDDEYLTLYLTLREAVDNGELEYFCMQEEEATTTERPHIQGYVHDKNKHPFTWAKSWIPTAHWEPAKGTPAQNRAYCSEEGKRKPGAEALEYPAGACPAQGKRTDVVEMYGRIKRREITTWETANEFNPSLVARADRWVTKTLMSTRKREWKTHVKLVMGPSGCGKTRSAYEAHPDIWSKPAGAYKWWDGYDGQEHVLWDEWDWKEVPVQFMNQIMDRYPCTLEQKGSHTAFVAKTLTICCNWRRDEIYNNISTELITAFWRRVDEVVDMW